HAIWIAQGTGDWLLRENTIVFAQARLVRRLETWNKRTEQLFVCDCAEHVLPLFEDYYPADPRPRETIAVARHLAADEATEADLDVVRSSLKALLREMPRTVA